MEDYVIIVYITDVFVLGICILACNVMGFTQEGHDFCVCFVMMVIAGCFMN